MIPYVQFTQVHLGPVPIQVWGTLVALGMVTGLLVSARRAKNLGLDAQLVLDLGSWILVSAMIGARVFHSFVYELGATLQDPWEFFRVWNGGFSVTGGFLGAILVSVWYLRRKHVDVWRYADATIFGLPIGLGIGRIGCFLIHDHPGTATDFFLAVQYPDGVARHDHGLYLSLNGFALALMFWWMSRRPCPPGAYLAVFGVWYGLVRFGLDFYRVGDTRYLGLTPAQYIALLMVLVGGWGLWRLLRPNREHDKMQKHKH